MSDGRFAPLARTIHHGMTVPSPRSLGRVDGSVRFPTGSPRGCRSSIPRRRCTPDTGTDGGGPLTHPYFPLSTSPTTPLGNSGGLVGRPPNLPLLRPAQRDDAPPSLRPPTPPP